SEAWAILGVYSNYNWLPDQSAIVIWSKGKIKKIDLTTYAVSEIPFKVSNNIKVAQALQFKNSAFGEEFTSKAIRHLTTSPDGTMVAFNAAGYLWKKDLPGGTPQRITSGTDLEFEPSFSANGNEITYVTWNDESLGAIWRLN